MSSGLTYVSFQDLASAHPETGGIVIEFSLYNEAYKYAQYMTTAVWPTDLNVWLWTSGPGLNGYFRSGSFTPVSL